jgi:hypothetical protein
VDASVKQNVTACHSAASLPNSKSDDLTHVRKTAQNAYEASDVIISVNKHSNKCKYLIGSVVVNIGRIFILVVKLACRYR